MPLTLLPNPRLANAKLRWIVEAWDGSCPMALTNDLATTAQLNIGPRILSSVDVPAIPFSDGRRAERIQYDRLVRSHGLTAYWRMAEFSGGATIAAEVATGSPIVLAWAGGGSFTSVAGPTAGDSSGAITFDGAHYFIGADDNRLDLHTSSWWWSVWFKTIAGGCLYAKCTNTSIADGVILDVGTGLAGRPRLNVHGITTAAPGGIANDNAWHHLYGHLDRSAQQLLLMMDGIEVDRVNASGLGATDLNTTRGPTIGAIDTGTPQLLFQGAIARMLQGPGVLTPEQVFAQYSAGVWFTRESAERRIISPVVFTEAAPVEFQGIQPVSQIGFDVLNSDGAFNAWLDGEYRGTVLRAHQYDEDSGQLVEDVFVGELSGVSQNGWVVSVTGSGVPLYALDDIVPQRRVRSSAYATAQANGAPLSRGAGFWEGIPGRNLSWGPLDENDPLDGWRFTVAAGNWAVGLVYEGESPTYDRADFAVDTAAIVDGERSTVVKLFHAPDGPVTFDARRLPDLDMHVRAEWDWMSGWTEKIGGFDAQPGTLRGASTADFTNLVPDGFLESVFDLVQDTATTDQLAVGRFLGAIRCNGTTDYWESKPVPASFAAQSFTVDVYCDPFAGQSGTIVCGPYSPYVASGDVPSWLLRFDAGLGQFAFTYRTGVNTTATVSSTEGFSQWDHVQVVKTPTSVIFRVQGVFIGAFTGTDAGGVVGPIVYPTSGAICRSFLFARSISATAADVYKGDIGIVRFSLAERTDRDAEHFHGTILGSPIEFAREFWERELNRTVDPASFSAAKILLDYAIPGHDYALRFDGGIANDIETGIALAWISRIRDLRFGSSRDGITVTIPVPQTQAVAAFSAGPPWNNVTGPPSRLRANTGEAVASLVIAYDPVRAGDEIVEWRQRVPYGLGPVGRKGVTFELPLVRNHLCADIVMEWIGKRLWARRQLREYPIGHEARLARVGQCIRLTLPHFKLVDGDDEVLARTLQGAGVALQSVPYDPIPFTYDGGRTLPTSAAKKYKFLNPGTVQSIDYNTDLGKASVQLGKNVTQLPTRNGARMEWTGLGGAGWAPVSDGVDATTLQSVADVNAMALVGAAWISADQVPDGYGVIAIDITIRAKATGTVKVVQLMHRLAGIYGSDGYQAQVAGEVTLTTSLASYTVTVSARADGTPFQLSDMDLFDWGFRRKVGTDATIDVAETSRTVRLGPIETPLELGHTKFWAFGPSATQPPTPVDGINPATAIAEGSLSTILALAPSGGLPWWIWAGVYNAARTRIAFIGPLQKVVT